MGWPPPMPSPLSSPAHHSRTGESFWRRMNLPLPLTDADILARRPPKPAVDVWRPHGYFVEQEVQADGMVKDVATVLLANKECPFRCLMCDLWKYTTDERT